MSSHASCLQVTWWPPQPSLFRLTPPIGLEEVIRHTQEPSVENSKAEYRYRTDDERLETFSFTSKLIPQNPFIITEGETVVNHWMIQPPNLSLIHI